VLKIESAEMTLALAEVAKSTNSVMVRMLDNFKGTRFYASFLFLLTKK
jgi:hypothetical protein